MRSFDFPSLHSDPEMPEGNNNSAEIRGFPSDLCGPKFFAKESRAELQRFPWVA